MTILEVTNLKKIYTTRLGLNQVQALTNVSFTVEEGEYVAIMGESGSGKTTLLNIIASLDKASSGDVVLDGKSTSTIKEKDISAFRRNNLGFVFQDFNLLDTFSVQDNIFLPLVLLEQNNINLIYGTICQSDISSPFSILHYHTPKNSLRFPPQNPSIYFHPYHTNKLPCHNQIRQGIYCRCEPMLHLCVL